MLRVAVAKPRRQHPVQLQAAAIFSVQPRGGKRPHDMGNLITPRMVDMPLHGGAGTVEHGAITSQGVADQQRPGHGGCVAKAIHWLGPAFGHALLKVKPEHVEVRVRGTAHPSRDAEERPHRGELLLLKIRVARILARQHESLDAGPVAVDVRRKGKGFVSGSGVDGVGGLCWLDGWDCQNAQAPQNGLGK